MAKRRERELATPCAVAIIGKVPRKVRRVVGANMARRGARADCAEKDFR